MAKKKILNLTLAWLFTLTSFIVLVSLGGLFITGAVTFPLDVVPSVVSQIAGWIVVALAAVTLLVKVGIEIPGYKKMKLFD